MYLEEIFLERIDFLQTNEEGFFQSFWTNISSIGTFLLNVIKFPIHFFKFAFKSCYKQEDNQYSRQIFERMYDLEEIIEKDKSNDVANKIETQMYSFLKKNIKTVEIVLNDIVYKIYFPILSKCREMPTIENKLKSNTENLENYTYENLNLYKDITIELKENYM